LIGCVFPTVRSPAEALAHARFCNGASPQHWHEIYSQTGRVLFMTLSQHSSLQSPMLRLEDCQRDSKCRKTKSKHQPRCDVRRTDAKSLYKRVNSA